METEGVLSLEYDYILRISREVDKRDWNLARESHGQSTCRLIVKGSI